ncbi:MAG: SDR family NAD(P)-dependent oxidoreductase [Janthinobacterium lividum]
MHKRFEGRLAVVTGAGRGIGAAIAARYASEGAAIAIFDVSGARAEASAAALREEGANARGYAVDVSKRADVAAAFAQLEGDFTESVRALVNNAAWIRYEAPADISEETLDRMVAVDIKALIWTMQAALPLMQRAGGGAIVNICSTAALRATPNSLSYCAVKGAVAGLTRAGAIDFGPHNIRVNAIAPGMVPTKAALANFDESALKRRLDTTPLGRFSTVEEVASLAAFLASDDSSFINGEVIACDGGRSIGAL